jgi:hypothetical protein
VSAHLLVGEVYSALEGSQFDRKRNSEKANIEQGITNIEVRYSIKIIFEKRLRAAIPHIIIRNLLFDILRFAVLWNTGIS